MQYVALQMKKSEENQHQIDIILDTGILELLHDFGRKTGEPINDVIKKAIERFCACEEEAAEDAEQGDDTECMG